MNTWKIYTLACLAIFVCVGAASEPKTGVASRPLAHWHGKWVLSKKLNDALGFTDSKSRDGGLLDAPPLSFQITLTNTIGDRMDAKKVQTYRDLVFQRMKHQIVATGKWEMTFHDDPGVMEIDCFVTEHEGATYLWVPANFVVVFGGKVSFVEGANRESDALFIDFNTSKDHLTGRGRSPDTFAYQRESK